MCTVSFIARRRGYLLGMNRDEQLTRAKGLPPAQREVNGMKILGPSEPGGGMWIALNEAGATLALINWYSITAHVQRKPLSRGEIVSSTSFASAPSKVEGTLNRLSLRRINPFRLIGIFPATKEVVEWRWNLKQLVRRNCTWTTHQWISSGFDEPKAQRVRSRTFRLAIQQATFGRAAWLRRLHGSHAPECGPFSTCMHRIDAATVSYTEITVGRSRGEMLYHLGAPCLAAFGRSFSRQRNSLSVVAAHRV